VQAKLEAEEHGTETHEPNATQGSTSNAILKQEPQTNTCLLFLCKTKKQFFQCYNLGVGGEGWDAAGMGEITIKCPFLSTLEKILAVRYSNGCKSSKGPT